MTDPESGDLIVERPTVVNDGATYYCTWEAANVQAVIKNLKQHSDALSAEVTWEVWNGAKWSTLYRSQMNLLAAMTRNALAKALSQRAPWFRNWEAAIDQLCILVPDAYRAGEPFLLMDDYDAPMAPPFLIERLLPQNNITVFYGDGETGKSTAAMHIACCVATGRPFAGEFAVTDPGPVLYLDWETGKEVQWPTYRKIRNGLTVAGDERLSFTYRHVFQPLHMELEPTREFISKHGVRLVIIDSIGPAAGEELNDSGTALRLMASARALGTTVVMIAHVNKVEAKRQNNRSDRGTIYGSKFFELLVRQTWELRSTMDADTGAKNLMMYNRKSNLVRRSPNIGVRVEFDPEAIRFFHVDSADNPTGPAQLSHRLTMCMRKGARTIADLAAETVTDAMVVQATLRRMAEKGDVRIVANDPQPRWGLAALGYQEPMGSSPAPSSEATGPIEQDETTDVVDDQCDADSCTNKIWRFAVDASGYCRKHMPLEELAYSYGEEGAPE